MSYKICTLTACIAFMLSPLPFASRLSAQCALPGSDICDTATPICRPEFCDSLSLNVPDDPHNGWCGSNTAIHNPRYHAFTAAAAEVVFSIRVDDCTGGINALQAAILGACPWSNTDVLDCNPGTSEGDSFQLQASGLIIGSPYWLVVDGSATSVCGYTITHTEGISYADDVPPLDSVIADVSEVCPGYTGLLLQATPTSGVHGYRWVAAWAPMDPLTSEDPSIALDVPEDLGPGPYAICARAFSACDTADLETCAVIHVLPRADTAYKDTAMLCPDAFPFTWNGTLVEAPGTHFSTAYSPDNCALDSTWTILAEDNLAISELFAQAGPCVTDSTLVVLIDFDTLGLAIDSFDLRAGDNLLGRYATDALPLLIPAYPGNATGVYTASVCRTGSASPACCITTSFEGPPCPGGSCAIVSAELTPTPCADGGHFDFIVDIDPVRPGTEGFSLVCNGELYGPFNYSELPVRIGPFTADSSSYTVLVFDNADPSCNLTVTSPPVECTTALHDPQAAGLVRISGNGSIPIIQAVEDIRIAVFAADGRNVIPAQVINAPGQCSLAALPAGLYFSFIQHDGHTYPVRLVRTEP